jgi:pantoate--beta-alanine ligase
MSSRNSYLDNEQLKAAKCLQAVLHATATGAYKAGARFSLLEEQARIQLEKQQLDVEYLAIRRASDLAPPLTGDRDLRILAAVRCGKTRLIDNLKIEKACNNGN